MRKGIKTAAAVSLLTISLTLSAARAADPAPFDLIGPGLKVSVTRDGRTLPIGQVPNLATGDELSIVADLPADQSANYLWDPLESTCRHASLSIL